MLGVIVIYVVLFGGLWWFMMRPQKKEQKRIQAMLASMEVGRTAVFRCRKLQSRRLKNQTQNKKKEKLFYGRRL